MDEMIVFVLPIVVGAIAGVAGYFAQKAKGMAPTVTLWLVWAAIAGGLTYAMMTASGWDGLAYLIGLLFFSAPSGVGLLAGGVTGAIRHGRQARMAAA